MKAAQQQEEAADAELIDAATTVEDLEGRLEQEQAEKGQVKADLQQVRELSEKQKARISELERELAVTREKWESEREQRETSEVALREQRRPRVIRKVGHEAHFFCLARINRLTV